MAAGDVVRRVILKVVVDAENLAAEMAAVRAQIAALEGESAKHTRSTARAHDDVTNALDRQRLKSEAQAAAARRNADAQVKSAKDVAAAQTDVVKATEKTVESQHKAAKAAQDTQKAVHASHAAQIEGEKRLRAEREKSAEQLRKQLAAHPQQESPERFQVHLSEKAHKEVFDEQGSGFLQERGIPEPKTRKYGKNTRYSYDVNYEQGADMAARMEAVGSQREGALGKHLEEQQAKLQAEVDKRHGEWLRWSQEKHAEAKKIGEELRKAEAEITSAASGGSEEGPERELTSAEKERARRDRYNVKRKAKRATERGETAAPEPAPEPEPTPEPEPERELTSAEKERARRDRYNEKRRQRRATERGETAVAEPTPEPEPEPAPEPERPLTSAEKERARRDRYNVKRRAAREATREAVAPTAGPGPEPLPPVQEPPVAVHLDDVTARSLKNAEQVARERLSAVTPPAPAAPEPPAPASRRQPAGERKPTPLAEERLRSQREVNKLKEEELKHDAEQSRIVKDLEREEKSYTEATVQGSKRRVAASKEEEAAARSKETAREKAARADKAENDRDAAASRKRAAEKREQTAAAKADTKTPFQTIEGSRLVYAKELSTKLQRKLHSEFLIPGDASQSIKQRPVVKDEDPPVLQHIEGSSLRFARDISKNISRNLQESFKFNDHDAAQSIEKHLREVERLSRESTRRRLAEEKKATREADVEARRQEMERRRNASRRPLGAAVGDFAGVLQSVARGFADNYKSIDGSTERVGRFRNALHEAKTEARSTHATLGGITGVLGGLGSAATGFFANFKSIDHETDRVGRFRNALRGVRTEMRQMGSGGAGTNFLGALGTALGGVADASVKSMRGLSSHFFSMKGLIILLVSAFGPLVAAIGALGAAAIAAGDSLAGALGGGLMALPGLLTAAATGVGALIIALAPVTKAFSLFGKAQKESASQTRQAKREIEDHRLALERLAHDQEGWAIKQLDAQQNLRRAMYDPKSTALDRRKAVFENDEVYYDKKKFDLDSSRLKEDAQTAEANLAAGGSSAADATARLNEQLAKLGPNTRAVVEALMGAKGQWDAFQKDVGDALFKPINEAFGKDKFKDLFALLTPLKGLFSAAADAMGQLAVKTVNMLKSGPWTTFFGNQAKANAKIISGLGDAALDVADGFRAIIEVVDKSGFMDFIVNGIKDAAKHFKEWANSANGKSGMVEFLDIAKQRIHELMTVGGNLFTVFKNLFFASSDFTTDLSGSLTTVTGQWAEWSKKAGDPNSGFQKWLTAVTPLTKEVFGFIGDIGKAIGNLMADPESLTEAHNIFKTLKEDILPTLVGLFSDLSKSHAFSNLLAGVGAVLDAVKKFLDNGGSTVLEQFSGFLKAAGEFIGWIVENVPGAVGVMTALATALATLAGVSIFAKFTGLLKLAELLKFIFGAMSGTKGIGNRLLGLLDATKDKILGRSKGESAAQREIRREDRTRVGDDGEPLSRKERKEQEKREKQEDKYDEHGNKRTRAERDERARDRERTRTVEKAPTTSIGWLQKISGHLANIEKILRNCCPGGRGSGGGRGGDDDDPRDRPRDTGSGGGGGRDDSDSGGRGGRDDPDPDGRGRRRSSETAQDSDYEGRRRRPEGGSDDADPVDEYGRTDHRRNPRGSGRRGGGGHRRSFNPFRRGRASSVVSDVADSFDFDNRSQTERDYPTRPAERRLHADYEGSHRRPDSGDEYERSDHRRNPRGSRRRGGGTRRRSLNPFRRGGAPSAVSEVVDAIDFDNRSQTERDYPTRPADVRFHDDEDDGPGRRRSADTAEDSDYKGRRRRHDPDDDEERTDHRRGGGGSRRRGAGGHRRRRSLNPFRGASVDASGGLDVVEDLISGDPLSAVSDIADSIDFDNRSQTERDYPTRPAEVSHAGPGRRPARRPSRLRRVAKAGGKAGAILAAGSLLAGLSGIFDPASASTGDPAAGDPAAAGGEESGGIGGVLTGAMSGASMGATIGSIIPGVGTVIGGAIGGLAGGAYSLMNDPKARKQIGAKLSKAGHGVVNFGKTVGKEAAEAWAAVSGGFMDHIVKPLSNFFSNTLPEAVGGFFTKTIPDAAKTAWNWVDKNLFKPFSDFWTVTVPNFFTETIPHWFETADTWLYEHIKKPIIDFFTVTVPKFFTEDIPNALGSVGQIIWDKLIGPIVDFFRDIGDKIKGGWNAVKDWAGSLFGGGDKKKMSGGVVEGTYQGVEDTQPTWLTIGEGVLRRGAMQQPGGKQLFTDWNEGRFNPADWYAGLNARASSVPSVSLPKVSATGNVASVMTVHNSNGMNYGDVIINNPVREKAPTSMRRHLEAMTYLHGRR